ncbi:hypothetical protein WBJ53_28185 [Spirosoma sp. SC4-14]|uniref:hypothetical protein n=1 Tax=Spirosoma sp. SC4-14 TaxID=3128900 RepID=UPI0030CAE276
MKKQFAIKAVQNQKGIILSAAKRETANIMKFMSDDKPCCDVWNVFQGQAPKTTFSL